MSRSALSNRQRKAQRRTATKAARSGKPALVVVVRSEPAGMAAREAVLAQVEAVEAGRLGVSPDLGGLVETGPGFVRASNRDGLVSLHKSCTLTDDQAKAGFAFRLCYEASAKGLGSSLGNAGEGGGASRKIVGLARSATELHRAYLLARLNQMERAVAAVLVDGRELHALRLVAGEGKTVYELAGNSGHARDAYKAALVRALDAIARGLRITGS